MRTNMEQTKVPTRRTGREGREQDGQAKLFSCETKVPTMSVSSYHVTNMFLSLTDLVIVRGVTVIVIV
jgi:hypothetical protein